MQDVQVTGPAVASESLDRNGDPNLAALGVQTQSGSLTPRVLEPPEIGSRTRLWLTPQEPGFHHGVEWICMLKFVGVSLSAKTLVSRPCL